MNVVSFYHLDTGIFDGQNPMSSDVDSLKPLCPPGHGMIEGHFDALSQRVDIATGEVVDYQPAQPAPDFEWNKDFKRWRLAANAQAKIDARAAALMNIASLEAAQPRAIREHLLGDTKALARLRDIDARIAALRTSL